MIQSYFIQREEGRYLKVKTNSKFYHITLFFSFGDISAETMFEDMDKLCIGILLMFIYMQVVLSEFSPIKLRVILYIYFSFSCNTKK